MDPTECPPTKRRKIEFADVDVDVDVDRISELGDDLLIEILSLLSTKEAVQTSLLSKRFQNLWASVPVLDLNFDEFCPDDDTINNLQDFEEQELLYLSLEEKFTKFVDGVFEHRDPSINVDSFNLKWDEEESNPAPAIKWLDTVAKLKPKFLTVKICTEDQIFQVPDSIFSCKSLQEMELNLDLEAIRPRLVDLPCLKKITLRSVGIVNGVLQKLSRLPALEEMVLSNCHFNTCEISSSTLKRLVVEGSPDDHPDEIIRSS
ncbi:F-box protein At4g22280-like [Carex rostrata]